jgi:hypothetical protein
VKASWVPGRHEKESADQSGMSPTERPLSGAEEEISAKGSQTAAMIDSGDISCDAR